MSYLALVLVAAGVAAFALALVGDIRGTFRAIRIRRARAAYDRAWSACVAYNHAPTWDATVALRLNLKADLELSRLVRTSRPLERVRPGNPHARRRQLRAIARVQLAR